MHSIFSYPHACAGTSSISFPFTLYPTQTGISVRWSSTPPGAEPGKIHHDFEKGDKVRVKDGMFAGMEGEVKDIIEAKNALKVELTIFGRPVGVDLEYWQVERS